MEEFEVGRKRRGTIPGSIIDNNGYWYWRVKLPGAERRTTIPLKQPGANHAMPSTKSRRFALQAAWREWERINCTGESRRPDGRTVNDVCDAWVAHAKEYYRYPDGTTTSEAYNASLGVRMLRNLHGTRFIGELEHADMLAVREAIVRTGVARKTVNRYMQVQKRMLAWALDEGLIRAYVKAELSQVSPLKRNRSPARETVPIRAVAQDVIDRTVAALPPNTADMVRVQALTGMRPEEVCALEWDRVDTSAEPWVYRPAAHKNAWREQPRVVLIGPRARNILAKYRADGGFPFSPSRALVELMEIHRPPQLLRVDAEGERALHDGGADRLLRGEAVERAGRARVLQRVHLRPFVEIGFLRPMRLDVLREPHDRPGGRRPQIEAVPHAHGPVHEVRRDELEGVVHPLARVHKGRQLVRREVVRRDALCGQLLQGRL